MLSYSVYNCLSNHTLLFLSNGVGFDIFFAALPCHLRTAKILLHETSLSCVLVASKAGGVRLAAVSLHGCCGWILLPLMPTCQLNPPSGWGGSNAEGVVLVVLLVVWVQAQGEVDLKVWGALNKRFGALGLWLVGRYKEQRQKWVFHIPDQGLETEVWDFFKFIRSKTWYTWARNMSAHFEDSGR